MPHVWKNKKKSFAPFSQQWDVWKKAAAL
jgi:hypothetical protein